MFKAQPDPEPSESFWKHPRSDARFALQWARRTAEAYNPRFTPEAPFLLNEVQDRMLDRAQWLKPIDGAMLDHSWAHPALVARLAAQYPGREVLHIKPQSDLAGDADLRNEGSLGQRISKAFLSRSLNGLFSKPKAPAYQTVEAPDGRISLQPSSVGLVWSNMLLHRLQAPQEVLQQWAQVLQPGGALFFSCLGPDSGLQLRHAAQGMGLDGWDYADMHDLGDALVHAGFSDPVMEMEKLTLTYANAAALLAEWRQTESGWPLTQDGQSLPGLRGRGFFFRLSEYLDKSRDPVSQRLPLTLEVIYGHAWRVDRPKRSSEARISVDEIGGRQRDRHNKNT